MAFELADRVLGLDSQLPVLFMSGDTWSADRGVGCVAKPFRPADRAGRESKPGAECQHTRGKKGSRGVALPTRINFGKDSPFG
jgi:hypothetical protein